MFTFGRQREKECALHYLKDPMQAHLIEAVVDAVHDLLEGRMTLDAIRPVLSRAFVEGGTGVLGRGDPRAHRRPSAKALRDHPVRFRSAAGMM